MMWSIEQLQKEVHQIARAKGWHGQNDDPPSTLQMMSWMALLHSEVSEATEEIRRDRIKTVIRDDGKPEGLASELADVVIRALDTAAALKIDLQHEIRVKMSYNMTRTYRHGGKRA